MSIAKFAACALLCLWVAGCEKVVIKQGDGGHEPTGSSGGQGENGYGTINPDTSAIDYLTVAQAQAALVGNVICVRGYVVASCVQSMSNADFKPPFEGSTAIILADEPVDTIEFQYATDDMLFPVCLTDSKSIRAALNMEDNPQLWNRLIYIVGEKSSYMRCPGMRQVLRYQLAD